MRSIDLTLSAAGASSQAIAAFNATRVHVSLDPALILNSTFRLVYAFLINLLSRTFPNQVTFDVDISNMPLALLKCTTSARFDPTASADIGVMVGGWRVERCKQVVMANCQDWMVSIGDNAAVADPQEPWNPILALVTACFVAARVSHIAARGMIDGARELRPFSILDFQRGTAQFDWRSPIPIGSIHLAGVGAIGSGFLAALAAHGSLKGNLHLVDHDTLDDRNPESYVFFTAADVDKPKVSAAHSRLRPLLPDLQVHEHPERLEDYFKAEYAQNCNFGIAALISAPDRRSTRRTFQELLPRRVWDASVNPSEIVLHHNEFDPSLACLECIYPPSVNEDSYFRNVADELGVPLDRVVSNGLVTSEEAIAIAAKFHQLHAAGLIGQPFESVFRLTCSLGELRANPESEAVLTPFAFISALAGVLLYFDFIKSIYPNSFPSHHRYNYLRLNPYFMPNPSMQERRSPDPNCRCCRSAEFQRLYRRLWRDR
jgi:molybdopterin/thiamine biosynthesis adenylyltransferase